MDLSQFVDVTPQPQAAQQQQIQQQAPQGQLVNHNGVQAYMRQVPDGSWVGVDYSLEWEGLQGDPGTVVQLKKADGSSIVFRGYYRDLLQNRMVGVWEPAAMASEPQPALNGMGAAPVEDKHKGTKRLLGITATGLAAGFVAWLGTKWFQGRESSE